METQFEVKAVKKEMQHAISGAFNQADSDGFGIPPFFEDREVDPTPKQLPVILDESKENAAVGFMTGTKLSVREGRTLTKRYDLDENGDLKPTPGATFGGGIFETFGVSNMHEFVELLKSCEKNQALMYGVSKSNKSGKVTTRAFLPKDFVEKEIVARIKDCFDFPDGPAIVALDYDPPKHGKALDQNELLNSVSQSAPALRTTAVVWATSSSSCISETATGRELRAISGQRVYFGVLDGKDIPRVIESIQVRSIIAGHGRIEISGSGAMLVRGLVDLAMRNPVQPDFVSSAILGFGLESRRPDPIVVWDGPILDSRKAIPDLSDQELTIYKVLIDAEKKKAEPAALLQRQKWIQERKPKLVDKILSQKGKSRIDTQAVEEASVEAVNILERALDQSVLTGSFVLFSDKWDEFTVSEALANPDKYDGMVTKDPEEPEYGGSRSVGKLFLRGKKPFLHSMAHGGKDYTLERRQASIQFSKGETALCTTETLKFLKAQPTIFSSGDALVRVLGNGKLMLMTDSTIQHYLGEEVRYFTKTINGDGDEVRVPIDPPAKVCRTILDYGTHRELKSLVGVVTAPTMLPDGTLVVDPGFSEPTGLYLYADEEGWPDIPENPSHDQMRAAFKTLWSPYRDYKWAGPVDRGVVLAGLFTALTRRAFGIAPGFAFDAAMQSSGKTKAAQVLVALLTGRGDEGLIPFPGSVNEEEMSKVLLSVAMEGKSAVLLDNVAGTFESTVVAACMTGGSIEGRVLGASKMSGRMPFNSLMLLSGNNMTLGADAAQRFLVARIEPMTATPHLNTFPFDPVKLAEENRMEMVVAGLTLLRGFVAAGMPKLGAGCSRFAAWDRLVRQAVVWVSRELGMDFGDPLRALDVNQSSPDQEDLLSLLHGWKQLFGFRAVTTAEVLSALEQQDSLAQKSPEISQLLNVVLNWGEYGRLPSHRALGRQLGFRVGRIFDDLRLMRAGMMRGGYQTWRLESLVPIVSNVPAVDDFEDDIPF
jgi:hypothetical protein